MGERGESGKEGGREGKGGQRVKTRRAQAEATSGCGWLNRKAGSCRSLHVAGQTRAGRRSPGSTPGPECAGAGAGRGEGEDGDGDGDGAEWAIP